MKQKSFCADDLQLSNMKEVITKYSEMVYRLAYSLTKNKYDADDIHQDVFVKYIRKQPEFDNEEHEKAWFIRVTVNCCRNHYKTAWKRKVISLAEFDTAGGEADAAEESELIEVVKRLPGKYRVVIHLFYYEEMSIEEISKMLGLKASTVRTRLTRARQKLRELLGGNV